MTAVFLALAVAFELAGLTSLKLAGGFTRPPLFVLSLVCYAASFAIFSLALRNVPVGIAYALWAALGSIGAIAIQIVAFHQPLTPLAALGVLVAALGTCGIYLYSGVRW